MKKILSNFAILIYRKKNNLAFVWMSEGKCPYKISIFPRLEGKDDVLLTFVGWRLGVCLNLGVTVLFLETNSKEHSGFCARKGCILENVNDSSEHFQLPILASESGGNISLKPNLYQLLKKYTFVWITRISNCGKLKYYYKLIFNKYFFNR